MADVAPEEKRVFVSLLRDKRAKLARTVRGNLGRLARDVFFDQDAEAKRASEKKKPHLHQFWKLYRCRTTSAGILIFENLRIQKWFE